MGTTPNYTWPYPDPGTTVDVPRDVKALALAEDTSLKTLDTAYKAADTAIQGNVTALQNADTAINTQISNLTTQVTDLTNSMNAQFAAMACYAFVEQTLTQSFPTAPAVTALIWDATGKRVDTHGMWSAANPSRLTCKLAGWYQLSGGWCLGAGGSGVRRNIYYFVGEGQISPVYAVDTPIAVTVSQGMPGHTVAQYLNVGDYVSMRVAQDHGGSINGGSAFGFRSFFLVQRMGS